jgi:hypothetical protein
MAQHVNAFAQAMLVHLPVQLIADVSRAGPHQVNARMPARQRRRGLDQDVMGLLDV